MKTIQAEQWGIRPDTGEDCTAAFARLLGENPRATEFVLAPGRYDFDAAHAARRDYALSNSDIVSPRHLSLQLCGMEDVVFNGNGAQLVFHGQTMPFTVDQSQGVTIKNLTIDWAVPLTAEGEIIAAAPDFIDVAIDPALFPHEVADDTLYFTGEGWREPVWPWGNTEFDARTGKVAFGRGDTFPKTTQALLPSGAVRFYGNFTGAQPQPGNVLVLRHGQRVHAGIFMQNSAQLAVEDVTLHATRGLGILAQFCEDLHFCRVSLLPNRAKGRRFASGHDDGIHLSANSGTVTVDQCSFLGLMDAPLNLHGIAAKIEAVEGGRTLQGRFMHSQSNNFDQWALPGQTVAFLDGQDMHQLAQGNVKRFVLCTPETFCLEFEDDLPADVQAGASLENLSRTAALICRNNWFGSCRARSLLVCTPQPVLIENNLFESAGAAILIAGDASTWYESGRCQKVTIRGNHFADCCLTSHYLGGEAIISIHPELPHPRAEHPCHRNITIENNLFETSHARLLYALCTAGLRFCRNRVFRSYTYPPRCQEQQRVTLELCTDAAVGDNLLVGRVVGQGDITRPEPSAKTTGCAKAALFKKEETL